MASATVTAPVVLPLGVSAGTWLARVLAALDRACASSADGARGL